MWQRNWDKKQRQPFPFSAVGPLSLFQKYLILLIAVHLYIHLNPTGNKLQETCNHTKWGWICAYRRTRVPGSVWEKVPDASTEFSWSCTEVMPLKLHRTWSSHQWFCLSAKCLCSISITHDAELPPVWISDSFNKFKFILRCLDLNWDLAVYAQCHWKAGHFYLCVYTEADFRNPDWKLIADILFLRNFFLHLLNSLWSLHCIEKVAL